MRIAGSVLFLLLFSLAEAWAGQWAPVVPKEQWAAPTKTEQWSAPTKTEQWSAPTKTEQWSAPTKTGQWSAPTKTGQWSAPTKTGQWAPEVRTEVRDSEPGGQHETAQPVHRDDTTDGKKLVWVNWNGQPYQAWILKSEGKRHYVTYKGWPSNYNEWISKNSIISEAQAKRMLAKQKKGGSPSGSSAAVKAYEQMDRSRDLSNRLHQETQQQYRDTERYYEERRYR